MVLLCLGKLTRYLNNINDKKKNACRHIGANLDCSTAVSDVLEDLRNSGSRKISFINLPRLLTMLDDFNGASIDFANSFRTRPTPPPAPSPPQRSHETHTCVATLLWHTAPARDMHSLLRALYGPTPRTPIILGETITFHTESGGLLPM